MSETRPEQNAPAGNISAVNASSTPLLGATMGPAGTTFRAWSTLATELGVCVNGVTTAMQPLGKGLHEVTLQAPAGSRYHFLLDGVATPDPYARFLPEGCTPTPR